MHTKGAGAGAALVTADSACCKSTIGGLQQDEHVSSNTRCRPIGLAPVRVTYLCRYNTWLLTKLTLTGKVFSFLFFSDVPVDSAASCSPSGLNRKQSTALALL